MAINIGVVPTALDKVLSFEMTVAEWIGTAVLAVTPYVIIGLIWAFTHTERVDGLTGTDRALRFLGSVLTWPALLFTDVCAQ